MAGRRRSRRTHLFRSGGAWAPGRAARASASPGPWPCPRPLAAVPDPVSVPRPGFTGSEGFERVSSRGPGPQPGPWEGSGARGAASPRVGCGRPLAGAPRAHSPARGAGDGALSSGRCAALARPGGVVRCSPGGWAGARRPRGGCAAPRRSARPGAALRDRRTAADRSLALLSRPPAGRGAPSRAGSAGNWPPVGDICIARPRPARPHPRGGTRPAATPPPLHLCAAAAGVSPAEGPRRPGRLLGTPRPRPGFAGGAPAPPRLCLSVAPPRTAPGVYPALNSQAGRAGAPGGRSRLTCAPPLGRAFPRPAGRPRASPAAQDPGLTPRAQQVAVQPLGRLAPPVMPTPSSPPPGRLSSLSRAARRTRPA